MAVPYFGDFAEDDTVLIPFNTFDSNDPQASVTITNLADADIMVHKDGGLTQIVTDGATVVINFDSITGNHMVTIDTSAHADYSTGSEYAVRIEGTTVDAGTINAWIGSFSIERAGGALALIKAGVTLGSGAITDASLAGNMEIVFETDFAANYNQTDNAWVTNGTSFIGTGWNLGKTGYALTTADWNVGKTGYTLTATTGLGAQTANITGNLSGSVGSVTGAVGSVAGNVDGSVGSNLELGPSEVNAQCDASIETYGLDHLVSTSVTGADVADDSIIAQMVGDDATADWDTYNNTTDSQEALRNHIGDGTNLPEAGGDGDHLTESGGTGDQLTAINLPNQTMDITGNLSGSVGSVTGAVGSVAGNVDGSTASVTGSVGSVLGGIDTTVGTITTLDALDTAQDTQHTTTRAVVDDLAVKKNATFSNFEFLMVLTSDHVTPATGLTVTGQRSINGAAFAGVSGTIAEVSNGIYQFDAVAADTNGDVITWRFSSATADDTFVTFKTVT